MSFWKKIFKEQAEEWTYAQLKSEQVPEEPKKSEDIGVDQGYLSITLRSMRIVNVRRFTTKYYGVVHSFISLNHLGGQDATFQTVTTPKDLRDIDPKNLDRVLFFNMPLVGPIPYRGGSVSIELGLFSVKESDLAVPYLDLLQTIASKAGVSVLTTALPFVEPLKQGVDAIIGNAGDAILEIGVSTKYTPPKTGWFVAMRAPKGNNIVPSLAVTDSDFRLVDAKTLQPIKDYPYMVFTISHSRERNDWYKLPYITEAYEQLNAAVRAGKYTDADDLLKVFRNAVLTSHDLLFDDAKRIVKEVTDKTKEILTATQVSKGEQELPPLDVYQIYA